VPPPYTPRTEPPRETIVPPTEPPAPPPPDPVPWWKDATKVILVLVAVGTLMNTVGQVVQGVISSLHGTKLDNIHATQEVNGAKIDATAAKVDTAAADAVEVKKELRYTTGRAEAKQDETLKKLDDTHKAVAAVGQKTDEVKAAIPKK